MSHALGNVLQDKNLNSMLDTYPRVRGKYHRELDQISAMIDSNGLAMPPLASMVLMVVGKNGEEHEPFSVLVGLGVDGIRPRFQDRPKFATAQLLCRD